MGQVVLAVGYFVMALYTWFYPGEDIPRFSAGLGWLCALILAIQNILQSL